MKATRPPRNPRFEISRALKDPDRVPVVPYDPRAARRPAAAELPAFPPPPLRSLAVYTQDPATPAMDVAVARVQVPWEPLHPGPSGCVVRVVDLDDSSGRTFDPLDLDALPAGYRDGMTPTTTDPRFAQQMVYALCMSTFERFREALGRVPDFAFEPAIEDRSPGGLSSLRLRVLPHGMREENAYYDRDTGSLYFGYMEAGKAAKGLNQPGARVFTSLSHDVVIHEMTHALVDGMRSHLLLPTNPDVDAFHEALSDLVALLHRFRFRDLVRRAIADSPAGLTSRLLTDLARQFGQATGDGDAPLRSALLAVGDLAEPVSPAHRYGRSKEPHDRGAILVAAVFDAFRFVFQKKTASLRALAPGPGERLPAELVELLAKEAGRLADQFLRIVIRAVDYCPPVDLTFGEYLRAMVTADRELVADDRWGYRESLVRAFRRYGITVSGVQDLTEDALVWSPPERALPEVHKLRFSELRHGHEPGAVPPQAELLDRATALGNYISDPDLLWYFGLAPPKTGRDAVEPPVVESVRTLRRISPDGELNFDVVAEVVQRRRLAPGRWMHGGATLIFDAYGRVRYAIAKNVRSTSRETEFVQHERSLDATQQRFFGDVSPPWRLHLKRIHPQGGSGLGGAARRDRPTVHSAGGGSHP